MVALNDRASAVMRSASVHACSDVTGFGLLGHTFEMASGSGVTIVLESKSLPLLPGARRLARAGCLTGGCRRNRDYLKNKTAVDRSVPDDLIEIALDPQTSGGLLIALPAEHADGLVEKLRSIRVAAARIGQATTVQDVSVRLV
jgi:selenide,water dikinase